MTEKDAIKHLAHIIFDAAKGGYIPYDTDEEGCAVNIAKKRIGEFYPITNSRVDKAAEEYEKKHTYQQYDGGGLTPEYDATLAESFIAGAEWKTQMGWHDADETPSIFGTYLLIHKGGWCVANYLGKGVVCESGWVESINKIAVDNPLKWFDLRELSKEII
jgi:hypothetical protein